LLVHEQSISGVRAAAVAAVAAAATAAVATAACGLGTVQYRRLLPE